MHELSNQGIYEKDAIQSLFGFHRTRRSRDNYLNAVKRGYLKDYQPLTDFFEEALETRLDEEK